MYQGTIKWNNFKHEVRTTKEQWYKKVYNQVLARVGETRLYGNSVTYMNDVTSLKIVGQIRRTDNLRSIIWVTLEHS